MTVEDIKAALDQIPNTGAINKARRKQLIRRLLELMKK